MTKHLGGGKGCTQERGSTVPGAHGDFSMGHGGPAIVLSVGGRRLVCGRVNRGD